MIAILEGGVFMSKNVRISYSATEDVKNYLVQVADQYNMTISGALTMIVMQYKFQNETLSKLETLNSLVTKMENLNDNVTLKKQ